MEENIDNPTTKFSIYTELNTIEVFAKEINTLKKVNIISWTYTIL